MIRNKYVAFVLFVVVALIIWNLLDYLYSSVNHALLTRKDIIAFANERSLSGIRVPEDGECTIV